MAKVTSLFMKGTQGTLLGLTFVKSKRYGDHVRSKRGTIKPAVLNDAFVASKKDLLKANQFALLIFNAVRDEHKDGRLWSRLLSIFRKELKEGRKPGVDCLKDLECSKEFRLDRLISLGRHDLSVEIGKKKMKMVVTLRNQPAWRKARSIDGYMLGVMVVFPDFMEGSMHKAVAYGKMTNLKEEGEEDNPETTIFEVAVPPKFNEYVLFLKLAGCSGGKRDKAPYATGMKVVATGKIPGPALGKK